MQKERVQCIHQVDMAACDLQPDMEKANFLRQQVKSLVPPHCTSYVQNADIWAIREGKIRMAARKPAIRRHMRMKARQSDTTARMVAGVFEIVTLMTDAHEAIVEGSQNNR
eukprot:6434893-Karenia_brevis.AAC.1